MLGDDYTVCDLIDPIIGWRGWNVDQDHFVSPDQGTPWTSRGELVWDKRCRCRTFPFFKTIQKVVSGVTSGVIWSVSSSLPINAVKVGPSQPAPAAPASASSDPCHCGINAFAARDQLALSRYLVRRRHRTHAVGTVALAGEVRVFERGYRADRARVDKVWATSWRYRRQVRSVAQVAGAQYMGVAHRRWWQLSALRGRVPGWIKAARRLHPYFAWASPLRLYASFCVVMAAIVVGMPFAIAYFTGSDALLSAMKSHPVLVAISMLLLMLVHALASTMWMWDAMNAIHKMELRFQQENAQREAELAAVAAIAQAALDNARGEASS